MTGSKGAVNPFKVGTAPNTGTPITVSTAVKAILSIAQEAVKLSRTY